MIETRELEELFSKLTDEVNKFSEDVPEEVTRLKEKAMEMIYEKKLL